MKEFETYRKAINLYREALLYLKHYSLSGANSNYRAVIYMIDGKIRHGGLADRLSGAITTFAVCKTLLKPFKILWKHPFDLNSFLGPNHYDWTISEDMITYNLSSRVCVKMGELYWHERFRPTKQIHLYTNFYGLERVNDYFHIKYSFKTLFEELFKPKPILERALIKSHDFIGGKYLSVCFRFQSLLGDFKERTCSTLDDRGKNELVERCIFTLENILHENKIKTLVTSDSSTFLNRIENIRNVYVIPGDVVHMDYTFNANEKVYMKSFVDLFMLAGGIKVLNVIGGGLRSTYFPVRAAMIGGVSFERVVLKYWSSKHVL